MAVPAQEAEKLAGEIFIMRQSINLRGLFDPVIDRLNALRVTRPLLTKEIEEAYAEFAAHAITHKEISIHFELSRSGVVRFSHPKFVNATIFVNSVSHAAEDDVDFERWVADQSYFFLKDICHVHQHHSPEVDTILLLQRIDDPHWQNQVSYSLHHYIIKLRRSHSRKDLNRALGVLSYARSFYQNCERENVDGLSSFNCEEISDSLRSRINEEDLVQSSSSSKQGHMLTALGFIIAIIALSFQTPVQQNATVRSITDVFAGNFQYVIISLLLIVAIAYSYIDSSFQENLPGMKDLRVLGLVRKDLVGSICVLVAIALATWAVFRMVAALP